MNGQPLTIQRASAQNTPVINLSSSTNGAHPLLIQRAQNNSVIHQTTTNRDVQCRFLIIIHIFAVKNSEKMYFFYPDFFGAFFYV
jgi:hypothetical protein